MRSALGSASPDSAVPRFPPYAASWVDRGQARIERLAIPAWSFYLGVWLAMFSLQTLLKWRDGAYPVGTVFAFHAISTASAIYAFAAMHYLGGVAARALEAFRPALDLSRSEYERLRYRLTTLPSRAVLLASACGAAWAVAMRLLVVPSYIPAFKLSTSPIASVIEPLLLALFWVVAFVLLFHTVHQLRLVSLIYRHHARIDLFNIRPLYSFAPLAARTSMALLILAYAWFAAIPRVMDEGVFLALVVLMSVFGVATFVLPLLGIRRRLVVEKQRLLGELHVRAGQVLQRFHARLDGNELGEMDALNKAIASLDLEQARLERMPTWPWQSGTLRGLLTAVLLPLFLWLCQQLLIRFLLAL